MKEEENMTNDDAGCGIAGNTIAEAVRFPGKAEMDTRKNEGTLFWFNLADIGTIGLKIKFVPPDKLQAYRKMWTEKHLDKKTHRWIETEDDDKRIAANRQMVYDAITDWRNVQDDTGANVQFSREGLIQLLDIIQLAKTDEIDDDGEYKPLMVSIVECMTSGSLHFGQKKN